MWRCFHHGRRLCYIWHWWFLLSVKLPFRLEWHFTFLINFKSLCFFSVSLMVSFSTTISLPLNALVPLGLVLGPLLLIPHSLWVFSPTPMVFTIIYRVVIPKATGLVPNCRLPGWSSESIWRDIAPGTARWHSRFKMEFAIFSLNFLSSGELEAVETEYCCPLGLPSIPP